MRRPVNRLPAAFLVIAVLCLAAAAGLAVRGQPGVPAEGLPITEGTAENAVDEFLAAIARSDWQALEGMLTARYVGFAGEGLREQLERSLQQTGPLQQWAIVSRAGDEPAVLTVHARFAKTRTLVMNAEAYEDRVGWRIGSLTTKQLLWRPPAWQSARTARLNLHVWPGPDRDLALLLEMGEEAFDRALLPLAAAGPEALAELCRPVEVYVYMDNAGMSAALGEALPDWIAGTWRGGAVHVITPRILGGDQPLLWEILAHELNHAVLSRYIGRRAIGPVDVPVWLSEGMAGVAARQLLGSRRAAFARAAASAELPSLDELGQGFRSGTLEHRYEYSFSLAEYISGAFGADALRLIVDETCLGAKTPEAIETVTGLSLAGLTAAWHDWLRGGLVWRSVAH